jgi:hypothetical protein
MEASSKAPGSAKASLKDRDEIMRFYRGPPDPRSVLSFTAFGRTLDVREAFMVGGDEPVTQLQYRPTWKHEDIIEQASKSSNPRARRSAADIGWVPISRKSLNCLGMESPPRQYSLWLVEQTIFDNFILAAIIINSVMIGMVQQYREPATDWRNELVSRSDPIFTMIFTVECVLKVTAFAFLTGPSAYIKDVWNQLDFVVVVTAWMSMWPFTELFSGSSFEELGTKNLRVFRVLRPLRSMNVVPEMKNIVNTLLRAIPKLSNVGLMFIFLMTIWGILAVHFWSGAVYRRCRQSPEPELISDGDGGRCWVFPLHEDSDSGRLCGGAYMCSPAGHCFSNFKDPNEKFRPVFKDEGVVVPAPWDADAKYLWCPEENLGDPYATFLGIEDESGKNRFNIKYDSFNYGLTRFDNLIYSGIVIFQCITMEGWVDIMYMMQDSTEWYGTALYFLSVYIMGALFLMNVALAVVWDAFSSLQEEEKEKEEERRLSGLADMSTANNDPRGTLKSQGFGMMDDDEDENSPAPLWADNALVAKVHQIASSEIFQNSIMFFIVFNVVTMMMDQYPPPDFTRQRILQNLNYAFTGVFFIEFLVLHIAYGPIRYWTQLVTAFDGFIVGVSFVELFSAGGGAATAFRGFRLLRVFKLAKKWTNFRVLVKAMAKTVSSMWNFTCILFLMMFVFSLMGMNFFATSFRFDETDDGSKSHITETPGPYCGPEPSDQSLDCIPRAHFDTILWAFVTCFQILSGENWNAVMYDGILATNPILGVVYFIGLVIVGQMIILSLFLAILMDNFEKCKLSVLEQEKANAEKRKAEAAARKGVKSHSNTAAVVPEPTEEDNAEPDPDEADEEDAEDAESEEPTDTPSWPLDYSFGIFAPRNPIRVTFKKIVKASLFDNVILTCILISSLSMALSTPLDDPRHPWSVSQVYANLFFTTLFFGEMIMKQIAYGLFFGKKAYWRQGWNVLDGGVVGVSVLDVLLWAEVIPLEGDVSFLRTLRLVRALRPLRAISRFPNLKVVVNTLFKSVPELLNLVIVVALCFLIFGLFSVSNFKGRFHSCQTVAGGGLEEFSPPGLSANWIEGNAIPEDPNSGRKMWTEELNFVCIDVNPESNSYGALWARVPNVTLSEGDPCSLADLLEFQELQAPPSATASLKLWRRPSADSPVCEVACPTAAYAYYTGIPPGCAPDLTIENMPSFCGHDSTDPSVGTYVIDHPGVPPMEIPGPNGFSNKSFVEWRSASTIWTMPCGKLKIGGTQEVQGCAERMCPRGSPTAPADGLHEQCVNLCTYRDGGDTSYHTCEYVCDPSGVGYDKDGCSACAEQCVAACTCPDFCSPHLLDGAVCIENGGRWHYTISQHFDSVGAAVLTLFEISTTEGWVDVMYTAVDATDPMWSAIRDIAWWWSGFFVLFIIVANFFLLNLCVGVIVDNYGRMKSEGEPVLLTDAQAEWIDLQKVVVKENLLFGLTNLQSIPVLRRKMFFLTSDAKFESFIMTCICLNTAVMAWKTFPEDEDSAGMRQNLNYVFAAVFTVEAALKLFALRSTYFVDGWNNFDLTCVLATAAAIIIQLFFPDQKIGSVVGGIRLFRIARLFRLLRFARGLNKLFNAFLVSIPKLMNVLAVLMLLLFLFAVMGMNIFGKVRTLDPHGIHANFRTFTEALLTLTRCMTGEGWNEMMQSLSRDSAYFGRIGLPCLDTMEIVQNNFDDLEAKCMITKPVQCGAYYSSVLYFIAYTFVISMVLLNLFVAVVLEGFEGSNDTDEREVITACIKIWKLYDKDLTLELDLMAVPRFVEHVQEELKRRNGDDTAQKGIGMKETYFVLGLMDVNEGKVRFRQAVEAVIRLVLAEDANPDNLVNFALELDEVANKGSGTDANSWKNKLEENVAPAIVQEMAVRRMQMVFRAKRSVHAIKFAKMVTDADASNIKEPTNTSTVVDEESDNNLNRGDMPAAG